MVNSTKQLREILFDKLGLAPQKKTKTGFSTDAQSLEKLRGPAPDHRGAAALPGGREAALDLRGGRCWPRWRRTGASTPRSTRPWPAPGGCRRTSPTCTTSRCAARRAGEFRRAFIPRRGMPLPGRRLQPDRAAGHRPPGRGPRPGRGVPGRHRHPHRRPPPASSASTPADVTIGHAVQGQDGLLRPGLRHGVLRPGPAAGHPGRRGAADPRRLLRGLPEGAGLHGPGGRRGPQPRATPRRCSAGAARSPSCSRATTGSARPASARP